MTLPLLQTLAPFPFILAGQLYDSNELKQNSACNKCINRDCILHYEHNNEDYVCSKGYNTVCLAFENHKAIFNGLIFKETSNLPTGTKSLKEKWIVSKVDFEKFVKKVFAIEEYIIEKSMENMEKNFSMFHDFKTSMGIFYNCTQEIISSLPGNTFDVKLKNASEHYKNLYNALDLITHQLGMVDIIINPKSITFGNKREINLYKLFDKMVSLFEYHTTNKNNIEIKLSSVDGRYINDSLCYEAIEFIPLILLDNALKYSSPYSTIDVEITQLYQKARVKVKSIGPFVKDENKTRIFEKFFRDENAEDFSKEGIGMGLWIAQKILAVHDSIMVYHRDINATGPIGLNIFEFDLATI